MERQVGGRLVSEYRAEERPGIDMNGNIVSLFLKAWNAAEEIVLSSVLVP